MLRRRPAAAAVAGVMAALFAMPGVASGTRAGEQTVSDHLKGKPGKFKVELREAGEPASSPPVIAATVNLEAGKASTVAVFGQLTDVKAALLTDDMSRPANSKSKVGLIQAIPGEAAVDLAGGGDVLISNARFPSASNYQEVPAGTVDVEIRKAASNQVLAKANNLKLPSGSISSLVAVGGIGEKVEPLDIRAAAAAVSATGGVATSAGGLAAATGPVGPGAAGDSGHRRVLASGPAGAQPRRDHAGAG
jgi:Domain of unknown function (DUF4397)